MNATFINGIWIAANGNIDANAGDWLTWDGKTVSLLLDEIEQLHGRLWTERTSVYNLTEMRIRAEANPTALLFDSHQVRELADSIRAGNGQKDEEARKYVASLYRNTN